ncbi:MAG: IS1634 family transposase [Micrococcales bacterium]|nr:IS1634 family transposase [Micrococcales bacterium]
MAWVRRVRTTSGATAVQIAESVDGVRRIVRHVGSAHDVTELNLLIARAHELLADDTQGSLDLGLYIGQPVQSLMESPPAQGTLVPAKPRRVRKRLVAPPRVVRTASQLLYNVMAEVYDTLGFSVLGDEHFKELVIAKIVEPTSLVDVDRVLAGMGKVAASLSTRNRTLKAAYNGKYRDLLAETCFRHASKHGDVSLCLYDVTSLRTHAEQEDAAGLRKQGYSKDRSVDPQVVIGLLVDRSGFPLEIGCFEGNTAETKTILPVIRAFQTRHGIEEMVIVCDAGMLSGTNLRELDDAGFNFIVGSKQTTAPLDLVSHYRWHGDYFTDGQTIDTITPKHRGSKSTNNPCEKAEPRWTDEDHPTSWRAVWAYSAKRFRRDNTTLNKQEERARAIAAGLAKAKNARFVVTTGTKPKVNETSLARARKVAGLKGYVTNIPATLMPAAEIINSYRDLWRVEQSFRIFKSDLAASPFFARKRHSIEAHMTIAFTALAVARTIQARSGKTIKKVLRELQPLRTALIRINGTIQTLEPEIPPAATALIEAITSRH